jgi:AmmeMemoRadiSam system protein A
MSKKKHFLVELAKNRVENHLGKGTRAYTALEMVQLNSAGKYTNRKAGVFVTITEHGQLRGCIGTLLFDDYVVNNVQLMAIQAAFHDPRFKPITADELNSLEYEVTILHPPTPVTDLSEIIVGKHGLIVERGYDRRGLLLPQVAVEQGWDVTTFLRATCEKAGLAPYAYKYEGTNVQKFEGEVIK